MILIKTLVPASTGVLETVWRNCLQLWLKSFRIDALEDSIVGAYNDEYIIRDRCRFFLLALSVDVQHSLTSVMTLNDSKLSCSWSYTDVGKKSIILNVEVYREEDDDTQRFFQQAEYEFSVHTSPDVTIKDLTL